MYSLAVIDGMSLSGHLSNIDEIELLNDFQVQKRLFPICLLEMVVFSLSRDFLTEMLSIFSHRI